MQLGGWVKLHRKLLVADVWRNLNNNQRVLMLVCLLLASSRPFRAKWKGEVRRLEPGQFITSQETLCEHTGLSRKQMRGALDHLAKWEFVSCETACGGTLIMVTNWRLYQSSAGEEGQGKGQLQTSGGTCLAMDCEDALIAKGQEKGQPGANEGPAGMRDRGQEKGQPETSGSPCLPMDCGDPQIATGQEKGQPPHDGDGKKGPTDTRRTRRNSSQEETRRFFPEVENLFALFCSLLAEAGHRTPNTPAQIRAAKDTLRLMLEHDGTNEAELSAGIRWAMQDTGNGAGTWKGWRAVIQSIPRFRAKWPKIKAQMPAVAAMPKGSSVNSAWIEEQRRRRVEANLDPEREDAEW